MKGLKVLFATLAVATLIVGAFAFSPKSTVATKKTDVVTYYFTAPHKLIGTATNHLESSEVTDGQYWTLENPGYSFSDGSYMAAITFDQDLLSKQDAINGVWSNFSPSSTLPADNQAITVSSVSVTIRRKANNQ